MFRHWISFLVLLLLPLASARGQASLYIPTDDPIYLQIRALMLRGQLLELNPNALPYTYAEVLSALGEAEDPAAERLRASLGSHGRTAGTAYTGKAGARVSSNGRLDPERVLDRDAGIYPYLESGLSWSDGPFVARAGFRFDGYWDQDPDGLDSVNRAFMRNDQSYAGVMSPRGSLMLGRVATNWAVPGATGLLLSDNARSFDAIHLRLGSPRLSFRSLIGELDSITGDGRFTGTAGDDSVRSGSERRWLAAHRLDWRPSPRFQVSVLEAVLYSGAATGLSLKYLNPVQFLVLAVDNRPKNDENNAILGLMLWGMAGGWTFDAQFIVDDLDLLFGTEPTSFAVSALASRPLGQRTDFSAGVEVVASRTYNTFQPEGQWLYMNRGLASQFSDYVSTRVSMGWEHASRPVRLEPYIVATWQGERDLRDPYRFEDDFRTILVGTVATTVRAAVRASFRPGARFFGTLDAGLNGEHNHGHVDGGLRLTPVVSGTVGMRWIIGGAAVEKGPEGH